MNKAASILAFLLLVETQAYAQPTAEILCAVPAKPADTEQYVIDLANGSATGKTRYPLEEQVQVVFMNKNPFAADYRFTLKEDVIAEQALLAFLQLFQTVPAPAIPNLTQNTTPPSQPAPQNVAPSSPPSDCEAALERAKDSLHETEKDLLLDFGDLKLRAEAISGAFAQLKTSIAPHEKILGDPSQPCASVVPAANSITSAISNALNPKTQDSLGQRLEQFQTKLDEFRVAVTQATALPKKLQKDFTEAECTVAEVGAIDDQLAGFNKTLQSLKDSLAPGNDQSLAKAAKDFAKAAEDAQAKAKGIADLLKPQNFLEIRTAGDYDEITVVTISVDRKAKDTAAFPAAPYIVKKLRFGGRPRFALAAGAAFTTLAQTDYGAVQGVERKADGTPVLTADGKPTLTRVVGIKDEADQRVTPMIALHTRLGDGGNGLFSGIHLTFGFAGNVANNGVNLEYLTGVSFSFAEERAFLTLGAYNGRVEKLQKGYFEGLALPAAITEDPVIRGRDWDFGFALAYKFR